MPEKATEYLEQWRRRIAFPVVVLAMAGCASTGSAEGDDPLEPFNRAMYEIHQPLETYVARPIVDVYQTVVPEVGRQIVSNFFNNITDLFSGVSGLLQGKMDKAGHDFGRVIVNTSFGLGGIIDFASDAGIPRGGEDLGLLLAHWGAGPRPYLFIPLLGPTTLRDGTGMVIRAYASPVDLAIGSESIALRNTLWGIGAVDGMAQGIKAADALGDMGLDRYTFIRSLYLQRRAYLSGDDKFEKPVFDEDYDDGYSSSDAAPAQPSSPEKP